MNNKMPEVSIFPECADSLIDSAIHFFDNNTHIHNEQQIEFYDDRTNMCNNIDELLQSILQLREEDNIECI